MIHTGDLNSSGLKRLLRQMATSFVNPAVAGDAGAVISALVSTPATAGGGFVQHQRKFSGQVTTYPLAIAVWRAWLLPLPPPQSALPDLPV